MDTDGYIIKLNLQLFAEEEKTEEPTPHRKREVRKEGQVARSNDLNAVANLTAVFLVLVFLYRPLTESLCHYLSLSLSDGILQPLTDVQALNISESSMIFMLRFMVPVFVAGMSAGLVSNFFQVGFLFAPKAVQPKLSNINPVEGMKRILSRRALVELLKASFKIVIVGWAAYELVKRDFHQLLMMMYMNGLQVLVAFSGVIFRVVAGTMGIFLVIAVFDYVFQRNEYKQRIRMTRKEVRDELRQTEGDPFIRSRLRERQREIARRRMMQSVPEATVVITNPTHLAVALKYDSGKNNAPELVAKGADLIAKRIVEIARANGVPVIENRPVARLIFSTVEIGSEIPPDLYKAVAEILAMLIRLRQHKR